jgi:hypothetical protein
MFFDVLEIVREFYHFSEEEKNLALSRIEQNELAKGEISDA